MFIHIGVPLHTTGDLVNTLPISLHIFLSVIPSDTVCYKACTLQ